MQGSSSIPALSLVIPVYNAAEQLPTTFDSVHKIVRDIRAGSDIAIACRVLPESRYLMSPSFFHYLYTRHLMSRAFNKVVQAFLLPGILDTQAGLKGFTAEAAKLCFSRATIP